MKRLFLILVIPFIIGICISYNIDIHMNMALIYITFLILGLIASYVFGRGYALVLSILFIFLGVVITANSLKSNLTNFVDKELVLEGFIESRTISSEDKSTYVVKVNRVLYDNKLYKVEEKILLNYYDKQILDIRDEVRVKGTLVLPRENTNPGLFNYKLYLQTKNIHTILNSDSTFINTISQGQTSQVQALRLKFQRNISNILNRTLSEKNSKLMSSIILGDSSLLDDETGARFRELGLSHILAVSGLHIGIIYLFISKTLRFLGIDKRISIVTALIIIWGYAFLIGFPASVLRASVMFSLLSLSILVYRRYDSINTLSLAALLLLFIRPLWIFDVGYQLSFIATASIIMFTPRINWLLSIYSKRAARLLSSLIAVQIGLFPVLAYHFNSYAVLSLISNLVLIPIFSFSLILCFILILVSLVYINAALILGFLLNTILNFADMIIDMFYRLSFVNIYLPSLGIGYILLYYFLLLISLRIIKIDFFKPRINKLIFNYMAIVILIGFFIAFTYNETTLEFIDVGQGDSCLISTKDKVILVDTGGNTFGNFDVGERIVLPYLLKKGISRLDAVFISHFHEDHAEGLIPLIKNIKIDNIFIGYENDKSTLFKEIIYNANKYNIKVSTISEGDLIYVDDNNLLKVLNPSYNVSTENIDNENNLSLVFILESYGNNILFTGDIEQDTEHKIVNSIDLKGVDIIKVPHHGSRTSSTSELLNKIKPSYAAIQVGKNNFGHPNNEVMERYKQIGATIYRNDENGLITFKVGVDSIEIYTYIKDKPSFNDIIMKYRYNLLLLIIYMAISFYLCAIYVYCYYTPEEIQLKCYSCIYRI
ncbi:DNA internalization-related competence protein ComEC/Rec2 [Proteiniborus sp. MB09-C3]|uniref:DNA internalization-related competence protein ComEC/Rec2 n=1 Tax=Proteiniborus sp. MB09-C3 TaxID=3050072 RepID=UPI002554B157|nr:DNA internalization-related competence protein ComEC/Rec2 [Proteiniborus sp. MB09-C3]WIV10667.1 DNA internalization-related competence protein ComEC/Rec2 [Proteiniborus sp. MB09-C3]